MGITSKNVWVIAIERIKQEISSAEKVESKSGETERTNVESKLIWIPGIIPVTIPRSIPNNTDMNSSKNIIKRGKSN